MIEHFIKILQDIESPKVIKSVIELAEGDKLWGIKLTTEKFEKRPAEEFQKMCLRLEEYLNRSIVRYTKLIGIQNKHKGKRKMARMMLCNIERIFVSGGNISKLKLSFGSLMVSPSKDSALKIKHDWCDNMIPGKAKEKFQTIEELAPTEGVISEFFKEGFYDKKKCFFEEGVSLGIKTIQELKVHDVINTSLRGRHCFVVR